MTGVKHLSTDSKRPGPVPEGKLRLYSMRFCPYAQRIHLVLDAKEIPYETVYINLTNKPTWLKEVSPLGKVPALELPNGKVLYESLIIADYLDEEYSKRPLQDKDPLKKALDRIVVERFNETIGAMFRIFLNQEGQSITTVLIGLDYFEAKLVHRQQTAKDPAAHFFHGTKPGMVDYMIWPWCERADLMTILAQRKVFELDSTRYPALLKWRLAMIEDEAVKKSILSAEVHAAYIQSKRDGDVNYEIPLNQPTKKARMA
ncbi:pyrimidodiazepine synthase-like [Ctenocephalides felis]|uniref:pyrimidodiazepine synthase-like n=1 Tax=Ctenocephalides felis TaxID=7515 RepID=UPI000E6E193D|nr:pyrimidodiazepine synthase-like [Ctenocephalides felis]